MSAQLVVVDKSLSDYESLLNQIPAGYAVLSLQSDGDGWQQIADYLALHAEAPGQGFSALHILSHASQGVLQLGSQSLNTGNLGAQSAALGQIQQLMAPGADLLLYGCDLAQGSEGQAFVTLLAQASGMDVAASTNLTGGASGDWVLEAAVGQMQTQSLRLVTQDSLLVGTLITGTDGSDTLIGVTGNDTIQGLGGDDRIEVTLSGADTKAVVDGGTGANTLSIQGGWTSLAEALPISLSHATAAAGNGWTFASGASSVAFTNIFTQSATSSYWQGTAQFATRSYQLLNDASVNALVSYPEYSGDNLMVFMVEGSNNFTLINVSPAFNLSTTAPYTLVGTQGGDTVKLGPGSDEIATQAGNDSIIGWSGNDTIWAGDGNDTIDAGNGTASFGSDTVDGGAGTDWLVFSNLPAAVTVNLANHLATSTLGSVSITSIEKIAGSSAADSITGGDIASKTDAMGNRVTEWLRGNAGNDTITGGAGTDFYTVSDYSNNTSAQAITANLGTGTASDGRGGTDTLVNIDFLSGGAGDDSLTGGSLSRTVSGTFFEVLRGNAGNDTLDGSNGSSDGDYASSDRADYSNNTALQAVNVNFATGLASDGLGGTDKLIAIDQVYGGLGNDTFTGSSRNETMDGGAGSDSIDGGAGFDQVRFQQSTAAVIVNLSTVSLVVGIKTIGAGTADDGMGGVDTLVNIENAQGSDFDDYFRGSDDTAVRQYFNGDGGNDTIDGGAGIDIASYGDSPLDSGGITASLVADSSGAILVADGKGGMDTLINIEGLSGSNSADSLTGGLGDDWLRGQGGSDTLDGGDGSDWAFYSVDPSRVTINLQTGLATDGWNGANGLLALGGTDTLKNIENAEGSDFNDSITGSDASNRLLGRSGNDTLVGGGGHDTLDGGAGDDSLDGGEGDDTLVGGAGNDYLKGDSGNDSLMGGDGDDTVTAAGGNATVDGGAGIDTWLGDAGQGNLVGAVLSGDANDGWNLVLESGEVVGLIKPNVGSGSWTVQGTGDNYATLMSNIEFMEVSGVDANGAPMTVKIAVDNSLTAPSLSIVGGDTPSGATQGNDSLVGTLGNDTIDGLGGNDTIDGGAGNDSLDGGAGYDVVDYAQEKSGVVVNLQTQRATDGAAGQDTLVGFEEVQGSGFNDELTGSTHLYAERFEGGAGNDTIDGGAITDTLTMDNRNSMSYVRASGPVTVDLAAGTSLGAAGNDVLRNINVVFGSASADVLKGSNQDAVAEFLEGGAGDDTIDGQGGYFDIAVFSTATSGVFASLATGIATGSNTGTDTLRNIEGLFGSQFADVLTGGSSPSLGSELFRGETGNDTIDGGAGNDWAFYDTATSSAVVTLGGTADGSASDGLGGTDVLRNIEGLRGSAFNDTLTGSDRTDAIELFEGREGADVIDGKGGTDTVWYRNSRAGVVVDLSQGKASNDGYGAIDTLTNIENVYGSRDFNDRITGNSGANRIEGNGGSDTLTGGGGNDTVLGGDGQDTVEGGAGDDSLDGGANDTGIGFDWVMYQNAAGAVQVNLATGLATGADGNDTVTSFDAVAGGNFDDVLTGDGAARNLLRGNLGNDTLDGGDGFDYADYSRATGSVTVSLVTNTSSGFDGNDILTNIEGIRGGSVGDLLTGDGNDNWLRGNGGDDTLEGGAGVDTADYYGATGSVSVSLESGTSSGADGADQLSGFENLRGSLSYGDELAGDAGNNTIEGVGGNDTLSGGAGQDFLNGGAGDDLLDGGEGNDSLFGGSGDDVLRVASGIDTLDGGDGTDTMYAHGGNYLLTGATLTGDASAGWTLKAGDGVVMGVIKPNLSTGVWTAQSPGQSSPTLISNIEQVQLQGVDASGKQMVLSMLMTNSTTAPMLTLLGDTTTPTDSALHGIVYDWKSHTLLENVAVVAGARAAPAEGDSAPIQFKNPTWDASGHATIEVWTHSVSAFENAGFGLQIAGATGISFTSGALPKTATGASAWSVVANVAGDVVDVAGMGLGAPVTQTDFKLGTVSFELGSAQSLAMQLQKGEVGDTSATPFGLTGSRTLTNALGEFSFSDLAPGSYGVFASRSASDSGNAVTSADALATLKLAVGINPNPDPDGIGLATASAVSPYQFMAADVVGTDARVTSADALAILKMAVNLPTAPSKEWMFVEEGRDFWDQASNTFSLNRNAAAWDHGIDTAATGEVNLVGVLKGDVNGSWAAPAGSTDLDVLHPGYFDALTQVYGMPMAQFGFANTTYSGIVVD